MKQMKYKKRVKNSIKIIKQLNLRVMDKETSVLKEAFDIAFADNIFALYKYKQEKVEENKFTLLAKLAEVSGSLSFLAIQILAANAIMNKNNFAKKEKFFKKKCGIAINHLHLKTTQVYAKKVKKGYLLNGHLTWASGYKIFDALLMGFHYDNKELEVLVPFKKKERFIISKPCDTFVGQGLNTVNITLKNFFVKDENIVSSNPLGNYSKNRSLAKSIHYSLYGLGKSALKHTKHEAFKAQAMEGLKAKKEAFLNCKDAKELSVLRVELFLFLQALITTALVLNGGKSILNSSFFQLYYREIIMFNTNGLNQNLKDIFVEEFYKKH